MCHNEDIEGHLTVRETAQQNRKAERFNRTLLEKIRCLLSNSRLNKSFWAEAMTYASHGINRLSSSIIRGKTQMEMWLGKDAIDYNMLRVFGCPAYYHVSDGKLEPRARNAIF